MNGPMCEMIIVTNFLIKSLSKILKILKIYNVQKEEEKFRNV